MLFQRAAALAACVSFASAAIRGFNTGSTQLDGTVKSQADFEAEFSNQQNLAGTDGAFSNARLYTMIQGGTSNTPISAIPAAISTNTGLLLGLWCSAGQDMFNFELDALRSAIDQYGSDFTDRVVGISVGSEDLYRTTPTSMANDGGVGAGPDVITNYIGQVRDLIAGTALSNAPIGHVDTWTTWVNSTNQAVADACDWVGIDAYPYFESDVDNPIEEAGGLFYQAFDKTKSATGKPTWVTESGWPVSGPSSGAAVPSPANARSYWVQVYCTLAEDVPVFWYTQRDANPGNKASFGITGTSLTPQPLFNLNCPAVVSSSTGPAGPSSTSTSVSSTSASSTTSTTLVRTTSSDSSFESSTRTQSQDPSQTSETSTPTGAGDGTTSTAPSGPASTVLDPPYPTDVPATASAPMPSGTVDPNTASNIQMGALAFLAVPALLAFMA